MLQWGISWPKATIVDLGDMDAEVWNLEQYLAWFLMHVILPNSVLWLTLILHLTALKFFLII